MNKNKIIQYLNSKKNDEYNYLDILLEKQMTIDLHTQQVTVCI